MCDGHISNKHIMIYSYRSNIPSQIVMQGGSDRYTRQGVTRIQPNRFLWRSLHVRVPVFASSCLRRNDTMKFIFFFFFPFLPPKTVRQKGAYLLHLDLGHGCTRQVPFRCIVYDTIPFLAKYQGAYYLASRPSHHTVDVELARTK
jgi:hypothetical protein